MPQNEDVALFIGIHHTYLLYRRQQLERSLQLLCGPLIQEVQRQLVSVLGKLAVSLQETCSTIDILHEHLKLGLRMVALRSAEAQYVSGVSPTPTNEASHNRCLDWARSLLAWNESCTEWVDVFEKGLKAVNKHRTTLQTGQLRRRDEIAGYQLNIDGLGGLVKIFTALDEYDAEMADFCGEFQRLQESVGSIPLLFGCQQDPSLDPKFYENQRDIIDESTAWAANFMKHLTILSQVFNICGQSDRTTSSAISMLQQLTI